MILRLLIAVCAFVAISATPSPKISTTSSSWNKLIDVAQDVEVKHEEGRSASGLDTVFENYMKSTEISLPIFGSTVSLTAKNLENNEMDMKLKFGEGAVEARKKSKLKKVFVPILVFILLKAITLIPLALGVLGLKTWNAIQLSFISFITSLGLAIWKLCGKLAGDHPPPPQIIHNAWEPHHAQQYAARADNIYEAQQMAYNSYTPQPQ